LSDSHHTARACPPAAARREKFLKAPVAGDFGTVFFELVPESGTKGSKIFKIHEKYSLWLRFELAAFNLTRCSFTISATQFF